MQGFSIHLQVLLFETDVNTSVQAYSGLNTYKTKKPNNLIQEVTQCPRDKNAVDNHLQYTITSISKNQISLYTGYAILPLSLQLC